MEDSADIEINKGSANREPRNVDQDINKKVVITAVLPDSHVEHRISGIRGELKEEGCKKGEGVLAQGEVSDQSKIAARTHTKIDGVLQQTLTDLREIKDDLNLFPLSFSGDTLENFLACSTIEKGKVVYKKNLPKGHKETYFEGGDQDVSLGSALRKAKEMGHTPVIMETRLPFWTKGRKIFRGTNGRPWYSIPEGKSFVVNGLWIPKGNFDWASISIRGWEDMDKKIKQNARAGFVRVSPITLLSDMREI